MVQPDDWPFDESPNVAVLTTRPVISGENWIAYVSHDEDDGCWQFHSPERPRTEDAMVVALKEVLGKDPRIAELANLPLGWCAWRADPQAPWERAPR